MSNLLRNTLWVATKIPSLFARKFFNRLELRKMQESAQGVVRQIAEAIENVLNKNFSPEEIKAIENIEKIRQDYLRSDVAFPRWSPDEETNGTESLATVTKRGSRSKFWATLLFEIVRKAKPAKVLEIGACVGISSAYQASALAINGKGELITLEGSPYRAEIAKKTLQKIEGVQTTVIIGEFGSTLSQALKTLGILNYAFVDGNHRYVPTLDYFKKILPHISECGLIVFDDINYSKEMNNAWKEVITHPKVTATIDLFVFGIAIVNCGGKQREDFKLGILKL